MSLAAGLLRSLGIPVPLPLASPARGLAGIPLPPPPPLPPLCNNNPLVRPALSPEAGSEDFELGPYPYPSVIIVRHPPLRPGPHAAQTPATTTTTTTTTTKKGCAYQLDLDCASNTFPIGRLAHEFKEEEEEEEAEEGEEHHYRRGPRSGVSDLSSPGSSRSSSLDLSACSVDINDDAISREVAGSTILESQRQRPTTKKRPRKTASEEEAEALWRRYWD